MKTNSSVTDLKYQTINIPLNKRMLIFQVLSFAAFVFLIPFLHHVNGGEGDNSLPKRIIPLMILFLLPLPRTIISIIKLLRNDPGLIINDDEIIDNSKWTTTKIRWDDVTELGDFSRGRVRGILIFVSDPESYIAEASNFLVKLNMKFIFRKYRTPLWINATALKTDKGEGGLLVTLQEILTEKKNTRK